MLRGDSCCSHEYIVFMCTLSRFSGVPSICLVFHVLGVTPYMRCVLLLPQLCAISHFSFGVNQMDGLFNATYCCFQWSVLNASYSAECLKKDLFLVSVECLKCVRCSSIMERGACLRGDIPPSNCSREQVFCIKYESFIEDGREYII